jgi:hypothetical protein
MIAGPHDAPFAQNAESRAKELPRLSRLSHAWQRGHSEPDTSGHNTASYSCPSGHARPRRGVACNSGTAACTDGCESPAMHESLPLAGHAIPRVSVPHPSIARRAPSAVELCRRSLGDASTVAISGTLAGGREGKFKFRITPPQDIRGTGARFGGFLYLILQSWRCAVRAR